MKHSQPHITLYHTEICFNCSDNIECNVESLIMILSSSSLASFIQPSFGSLKNISCNSLTETWSNNFGTSCGSVWSSDITLRQSLEIGYLTTWVWRVIHLKILPLIWSLIFKCPFRSVSLVYRQFPTLMDLRFDFSDSTQRIAVLFWKSNILVNNTHWFLSTWFFTVVWDICKLELTSLTLFWSRNHCNIKNVFDIFGHHIYHHVDIYFLCYSKFCVQQKACWSMIFQYQ